MEEEDAEDDMEEEDAEDSENNFKKIKKFYNNDNNMININQKDQAKRSEVNLKRITEIYDEDLNSFKRLKETIEEDDENAMIIQNPIHESFQTVDAYQEIPFHLWMDPNFQKFVTDINSKISEFLEVSINHPMDQQPLLLEKFLDQIIKNNNIYINQSMIYEIAKQIIENSFQNALAEVNITEQQYYEAGGN
jgi:hypothetical protein